jgi:hypothetical protein
MFAKPSAMGHTEFTNTANGGCAINAYPGSSTLCSERSPSAQPAPSPGSRGATGMSAHLCISTELENIANPRAIWYRSSPCTAREITGAISPRRSKPTLAKERPQYIQASISAACALPSWTLHGQRESYYKVTCSRSASLKLYTYHERDTVETCNTERGNMRSHHTDLSPDVHC